MADSVVVAAISGAAGNLLSDGAKRVAPVLWRGMRDAVQEAMQRALPQARWRFEQNTATFVSALADEVARGAGASEGEEIAAAIATQLEDPDVAVAVMDALRAAGRTPRPDRHRAVAKLVAARLAAPSDSGDAVVANLAVRAVEALAMEHLRTLALLALTHYVARPNPASRAYPRFPERPIETLPGAGILGNTARDALSNWIRELTAPAEAYAEHLVARAQRGAEAVGVPDVLPESLMIHLMASGCVIRHNGDPVMDEALTRFIEPPSSPSASAADRARERAVQTAYRGALFSATRGDEVLRRLSDLWRSSLHQFSLTPPGFLIGLASFDAVADEDTSTEWRWAGVAEHAVARSPYEPVPAFDERWSRDPRFHRVIEDTLKAMQGRGIARGVLG
ncbi:hypothetical protein tb265_20130 [Gemmatimonadetes bacterium T265]|nr:hypothetical protein tb265_20130 [Gemmatimonadetes bacterium T265]